MINLLGLVLDKVVGRLWNKGRPESKTQIATASSIPVATGAALMLIQEGDPMLQVLGGILMIISAGMLVYKDGSDD